MFWSFTLVGMKYCGSSAREAEQLLHIALMPELANPVDKNAIGVYGVESGMQKMLGHVSISTQPPADKMLMPYGLEGTVYEVYESYRNPKETAVFFRINIRNPMSIAQFMDKHE